MVEYTHKSAVLSEDGKYRYVLRRQWSMCDATQFFTPVFICLNPSTADESVDDPTVRRCVGFAKAWGWCEVTILNLFALRCTDPRGLVGHPDPRGPENEKHLLEFGKFNQAIACWGVGGALMGEGKRVSQMLAFHGCELLHLGLTKDGYPRHPLYLPSSARPVSWVWRRRI
jgi:hypothetical protein